MPNKTPTPKSSIILIALVWNRHHEDQQKEHNEASWFCDIVWHLIGQINIKISWDLSALSYCWEVKYWGMNNYKKSVKTSSAETMSQCQRSYFLWMLFVFMKSWHWLLIQYSMWVEYIFLMIMSPLCEPKKKIVFEFSLCSIFPYCCVNSPQSKVQQSSSGFY